MDVPAHPAVAPLPMRDLIEEVFDGLATPFYFGQILVTKREGVGFVLLHRDDESLDRLHTCLLYTSPSPRDGLLSRMPSSA